MKKQPRKAQMWCCVLVHQASVHLISDEMKDVRHVLFLLIQYFLFLTKQYIKIQLRLWPQFLYVLLMGWSDSEIWLSSSDYFPTLPVHLVSMARSCVAHPAHASSFAGFGPRCSWGCDTCRAWHWDWRCHPCWRTRVRPAPRCSDTPAPVSVSPGWKETFVRNETSIYS